MASKRYTKRTTKKYRFRLSPKETEDIIRQEFTDNRGNRFIFRMTGKPHSPKKPTIEGTVQYNDANNNN